MTGFVKILLLFVLLAAVAFVAGIDAGRVSITWFNVRIETTGVVLVLVMALISFISMALMRMLLALAGVPEHVAHWREKREWAKKEAAVEKTEVIIVQPVNQPKPKTKPKARGKK